MKIGVCVGLDTMENMEGRLNDLVNEGFDNCQIVSWNPALWTDKNAETLHKMLAERGIAVSAFWCGWQGPAVWDFYEGQKTLGLVPPVYRETRIGNLCDGADFAKRLGVQSLVTHMGFIPENPNDPLFDGFCGAARRVAEHLKRNQQNLLFETGQETPVTMLRSFEKIGCDNLGVNLDTANLILYGKGNPVDSLVVFGEYVQNIHAKDGLYPTNGHDLGREVAIGQGKVDFRALFYKLRELGYDSFVTIEREISGEQQISDIRRAKGYLSDMLNGL